MISLKKQEELLSFLPEIREAFSGIDNIQIIGFGAKQKKGKILNECAFRFYVQEKLPLNKVPKIERIPTSLFGIQTDVISHFQRQSIVSVSTAPVADDNEYRDQGIRGGISIRNEHFDNDHPSGYGTLGVLARRVSDNALVGLTCSHVVNTASDTPNTLDTRIGQPQYWVSCCCCPRGWIGNVSKATINNDLDCALIAIDEDIEENVTDNNTENKIEGIPLDIAGAALPLPRDLVRKHGRSSGLTAGVIIDLAYGTNQILIESTGISTGQDFANHGDSGAAIVNEDDQVIGLLVSAAQEVNGSTKLPLTKGIATLIKPVMEDLGISIAGVKADEVTVPNRAKPWPGGQTDDNLNPIEVLFSTDFGLTGNVNWDLSTGASGATIVSGGQTATGVSSISVRYGSVSTSRNKTDAVIIKVTKGGEEVIRYRTIFKITPRINTAGALDGNNTKRFTARGGSNDDQAGVALPGANGATWFLAKAEIIYDIEPADIRWDGNGVTNFVVGPPSGIKGELISRRQTQFNKGRQASGDAHRVHTEEPAWIDTSQSTVDDFQEPSTSSPAAIFRLAEEGFDPVNLLQGYDRTDYRDYLEFNDGSTWIRITPFMEWFANLTADLNGSGTVPPTVGALNDLGTGATLAKIPNGSPVVNLNSSHREFKVLETVTLAATATDPNNDEVTIKWVQIDGPAVTLSSETGDTVTFPGPNDDFHYKFQAFADDGTGDLVRTAGNHLSEADLTGVDISIVDLSLFKVMSVNVISWMNFGGGDPVPERNMDEFFSNTRFGIGNVPLNWDVTQGGTNAEIIEADGVAVAPPTATHNGATEIVVRYNNKSGDLTRAQSVKIQATNPNNGKSWFKRRTVFRVTVAVHATDTKTHKIPSTLGNVGKDHFCTVKQTGNMVLQATLDPMPPVAQITWNSPNRPINSPAVAGDRRTARINRNPASGLELPIEVNVDGGLVYEGFAWIIWGTMTSTLVPITRRINTRQTIIEGGYNFVCTIQPASIVPVNPAAVDIPDLRGANAQAPPDVSGGDVDVRNSGVGVLSAGANRKWDISRRIRVRVINAANVPTSAAANPGFFVSNLNYPSASNVGNDDQSVIDPETNNPYTNGGRLLGIDTPRTPLFQSEGSVGDTFEKRNHFQEFGRVELNRNWYVITDGFSWKIHHLFIKESEILDLTDYNSDGDIFDTVWLDNGSIVGLNNTGF